VKECSSSDCMIRDSLLEHRWCNPIPILMVLRQPPAFIIISVRCERGFWGINSTSSLWHSKNCIKICMILCRWFDIGLYFFFALLESLDVVVSCINNSKCLHSGLYQFTLCTWPAPMHVHACYGNVFCCRYTVQNYMIDVHIQEFIWLM
jgi:hypothetical protein